MLLAAATAPTTISSTMWEIFTGKRPSEAPQPSRNVRRRLVQRRLVFGGTESATLEGFINMWNLPLPTRTDADLSESGSLFADDAYVRKEYVELYDLIRTEFAKQKEQNTAIVRGSSGTGKSAFLRYVISRIRDEVRDVLVVQGETSDHTKRRYLHLSTTWWGRKFATHIETLMDACQVQQKCSWTIVHGCDWDPIENFTVGAPSPSTPWKGFRQTRRLVELCMPLWPLDQLQDCRRLTSSDITDKTLDENYQLIGGIARWALGEKDNVEEQISSVVKDIDFETVQQSAMVRHATKSDAKELVHRLVSWSTPLDEHGNRMYRVTPENPIHYRLISRYVSKKLATKAATLSLQKRKTLISDLKTDSAASAYRGVIFEAYAIDRLVCGGKFQLRKCTTDRNEAQEVIMTLPNTSQQYAMADLQSLDVSDALNRIIVPDARNFESTDAFCVVSQQTATPASEDIDLGDKRYETLQFQMTVGESHPTKLKGVKDVFQKVKEGLHEESEVKCSFVYVVPNDVQECYLAPQSVLTVDGKVRVNRDPVFSDLNQYRLVINY